MGVIHRNIKPGNIFMDNNLNVKIGDFVDSVVKKNNIEKINDNSYECLKTCFGVLVYNPKMIEKVEYDQ